MPVARPKNILHVINGEYYAGAERVQDLLAEKLPPLGYRVSFACLKPRTFPTARHYQEAPLHPLPMASAFDLGLARRLAGLIRKEGHALIHSHYTRSALVGGLAAALSGRPLVMHVHGVTGFDSVSPAKRWLNILVERLCLLGAAQVIVVSEDLRRRLSAWPRLAAKIRVIHNGVPTPPALARRELDLAAVPVIGALAFWRPGKGLEILLQALAQAKASGRPSTLRLVGGFLSPDYEARIRILAAELGLLADIAWLGPSRAVDRELGQMDALVLPSLSEGLPMVILEAMAAGVPVVASQVGGIPELIRQRQDGLLVPAQDPAALAQALGELLGDRALWASLRHSAYQRQKTLFSDQRMAAAVAAVYDRLLGPSGQRAAR